MKSHSVPTVLVKPLPPEQFEAWSIIFGSPKLVQWVKNAVAEHPTTTSVMGVQSIIPFLSQVLEKSHIKAQRLQQGGVLITFDPESCSPASIQCKRENQEPEFFIRNEGQMFDGPLARQAFAIVLSTKLNQFKGQLQLKLRDLELAQNKALLAALGRSIFAVAVSFSELGKSVPICMLIPLLLITKSLLKYRNASSRERQLRNRFSHLLRDK